MVERSVEAWTGEGHFLQIAGFAFKHDPAARAATDLTLLGQNPRPIDSKEEILAVTVDFLVDPGMGNQDGYKMLGPSDVVERGPDLKTVVLAALEALQKEGKPLAPAVDGRICNTGREGPCLARP